jgi:hypothetical protein
VKDGKVVFREDEIAVEWPYSVEFPDGGVFSYTPQTAVFRACFQKKEPDATRSHFVLLPERESAPEGECLLTWEDEPPTIHKTVTDLDSDGIRDTVWFDVPESTIVCRLSSRDFLPVESLPIEITNDVGTFISETDDGFCFSNHWMRAGYDCFFRYEPKTGKIRLVVIDDFSYGNVVNDGSGRGSVDMLTGRYIGDWNYSEHDSVEPLLVAIPTIVETMKFPAIYLENFAQEVYFDYDSRSAEYYSAHKEKSIRERHDISEIAFNDTLSVQFHPLTREEYELYKRVTEHQRQPLTVVTQINSIPDVYDYNEWRDNKYEPLSNPFRETATTTDEIEKMLGGRLKIIDSPKEWEWEGKTYPFYEYEITFNDGTKYYINYEAQFAAWFPQLEALLFVTIAGSDFVVELNKSADMYDEYMDSGGMNPLRCAVSPDKRWRINGGDTNDIADEMWGYWLEKWNDAKKIYEYVGAIDFPRDPDGIYQSGCVVWSWLNRDSIVAYVPYPFDRDEGQERYYDITIFEKP